MGTSTALLSVERPSSRRPTIMRRVAKEKILLVLVIGGLLQATWLRVASAQSHESIAEDDSAYPVEFVELPGHDQFESVVHPLPHTYIQESDLPLNFRWDNVGNVSYLTKPLNQHVPGQWCGSCWAHSALSSLADRIKIDRMAKGDDINLSIQYVLNCGGKVGGSCLGGSHSGAYQFIFQQGYVPYETCQPYLACSNGSTYGFCPYVDTSCTPSNICKTCDLKLVPSRHPFSQECRAIGRFPNASIAEYGRILGNESDPVRKIKAEILARGPVAAALNGKALHNFHGGTVFSDEAASREETHSVQIYGWETDPVTKRQAWLCRNSWGQYWAEMGNFRIELGKNILGIEQKVAWATPLYYTEANYPCWEDGKNCGDADGRFAGTRTRRYVDPSTNLQRVQQRLLKNRRS